VKTISASKVPHASQKVDKEAAQTSTSKPATKIHLEEAQVTEKADTKEKARVKI
jgi:hypothetical protein